jgi:hypothetical protein
MQNGVITPPGRIKENLLPQEGNDSEVKIAIFTHRFCCAFFPPALQPFVSLGPC